MPWAIAAESERPISKLGALPADPWSSARSVAAIRFGQRTADAAAPEIIAVGIAVPAWVAVDPIFLVWRS